jgi:hypothetical protein
MAGAFSSHVGWSGTSAEGGDGSTREPSVGRTPMTLEEALIKPTVPIFDIATLAMLNHSKESINSFQQLSIVDLSDSNPRQRKSEGNRGEKGKGYVHSQALYSLRNSSRTAAGSRSRRIRPRTRQSRLPCRSPRSLLLPPAIRYMKRTPEAVRTLSPRVLRDRRLIHPHRSPRPGRLAAKSENMPF